MTKKQATAIETIETPAAVMAVTENAIAYVTSLNLGIELDIDKTVEIYHRHLVTLESEKAAIKAELTNAKRLERNRLLLADGTENANTVVSVIGPKLLPIVENSIGTSPSTSFSVVQKVNEGDLVTSCTFIRQLDIDTINDIQRQKDVIASLEKELIEVTSGKTRQWVQFLESLKVVSEDEIKAKSLLDVKRVKGRDMDEEEKDAGCVLFNLEKTHQFFQSYETGNMYAVQVSVSLRPKEEKTTSGVRPESIRSTAPTKD